MVKKSKYLPLILAIVILLTAGLGTFPSLVYTKQAEFGKVFYFRAMYDACFLIKPYLNQKLKNTKREDFLIIDESTFKTNTLRHTGTSTGFSLFVLSVVYFCIFTHIYSKSKQIRKVFYLRI